MAFCATIASLPGTFVTSGTPKIYFTNAKRRNSMSMPSSPEFGTPIYSAAPESKPVNSRAGVGGIDHGTHFAPLARQILVSFGAILVDSPLIEQTERTHTGC
jgi:hypothetical protein